LEGWITPTRRPNLPAHGPRRSLAGGEEELRDLVEACRAGRLSDVTACIEAARPLQMKPVGYGRRRTTLLKADRPPTMRVRWNKAGYVRVSREDLYALVWSTPMVKASRRYGLSDNGLRRICKKLNVPTPRGYWVKERRSTRRARLPEAREGWAIEAWLPRPSAGG
jgi:hypothetical protein